MNTAAAATIECHPPERRRRTEIHMCHGSCCCCCCCLHTIGGIVGASVAPAFGANNRMPITYYYDEEDNVVVPDITKSGVSAVKIFWFLTLAAAIIGPILGAVLSGMERGGRADAAGSGFLIGLVIVLMAFPAIQLACAIITLIWLSLTNRSDKAFQLKQVGKITLGLFLGTLAGVLVMVGIGVLITMASR